MSEQTEKTEKTKPKAKKPSTADEIYAVRQELAALKQENAEIKAKLKIVTDGYQFAADQIRPLFGMGAVALVFDSIYERLTRN